jgi:hypothetical protein
MSSRFQDLVKKSKAQPANQLRLLLLGKRGGGKSDAAGTLQVKTLLLTFVAEDHSISSAKMSKGDVDALFVDVDPTTGVRWTAEKEADKIFNFLCEILEQDLKKEGYGAVVFDGYSELDRILAFTKKTLEGVVKGFGADGVALNQQHEKVTTLLGDQHRNGLHVVATCALNSRIENGSEILEPALRGNKTVSNIAGQFPDIAVVGRAEVLGDDGETEEHRVLQFSNAVIRKEGAIMKVDKNGRPINGGVRIAVVEPRLAGCTPPDMMEVNLAELAAMKKVGA